MNSDYDLDSETDAVIDEVRAIRRSICDKYGNDLDKLGEHLRVIEAEYRARSGRFVGVPRQSAEEFFPDLHISEDDPMLSELRKLRKA
jgi:hypothetical protein